MAVVRLYNALTKKVEGFSPIDGQIVKMYTCGPSVYDHPHIGNFRTYVVEDSVKRWLTHRGYRVRHVMPITDVELKSLERAKKEKIPVLELIKPYTEEFFGYVKALNLIPAKYVYASSEFPQMLHNIQKLMREGFAYAHWGKVFFRLAKAGDYGALIGRERVKIHDTQIRKSDYDPSESGDFLLFRGDLGYPRPDWPMHCCTIGLKHLGSGIDIHMGGCDNTFSHHENTKCIAEALAGRPYARFWMHVRHLLVGNKKMSKSKGNYVTVSELLRKYQPNAIRLFLLSRHYMKTLNLTENALADWQKAEKKLAWAYQLARAKGKLKADKMGKPKENRRIEKLKTRFFAYLEDDFRTDKALKLLAGNAEEIAGGNGGRRFFEEAFFIFGLRF